MSSSCQHSKKHRRRFHSWRRKMGCAFCRPSLHSPNPDLEKLKQKNGYLKGRGEVARNEQRQLRSQPSRPLKSRLENGTVAGKQIENAGGNGGNGGGERALAKDTECGKTDGGNVLKRISQPMKIGEDEVIDGWPKWLVDNVPKHSLDGLVPKSADSYDKLAKIGHGTYSNVYKARERETGKIVALKKVRFDTSEPESIKFMAREIMILQKLDHPNVIKLRGLATSRMHYSLYLVFGVMRSDLTHVISRSNQKLTEAQIKCYMKQLLSGLQHCHERGILHRDIKASNLLIDKKGILKIADFGLANFYSPKPSRPLTSRVVTLWYRAPELLLGSTDYGVGVDIWSAGCLLAEMFIGRPIMPGRNEIEQLHRIFKLCGSPSDDYWKRMKLPTSFRPQHSYKSSLEDAFKAFPSSTRDLLITLLDLDPARRGTAESVLQSQFFSSSPLPCDVVELPPTHKDESSNIKIRKKRRSFKKKQFQADEVHPIAEADEINREDSDSVKSEKVGELISLSQELIHSGSSGSSGSKFFAKDTSMPGSLTPALQPRKITVSRTESHPNALRNIKNYTDHLQASITDIISRDGDGKQLGQYSRSLSTLNFRSLDPDKISKVLGFNEDL